MYSTVSPTSGLVHSKVPLSRRFASTHAPDSSKSKTFSRLRDRFEKTKRSRDVGVAPRSDDANPLRPLNDLRLCCAQHKRNYAPRRIMWSSALTRGVTLPIRQL